MTSRSQDNNSLQVPSSDSTPSTSRPSSTNTSSYTDSGEAISSFKMAPEAVGVLESVINMNKALESQIDALRLRLNVEAKHHDSEKQKIISDKEQELTKKEREVDDLKDSLVHRDDRITGLVKESEQKDRELQEKVQEIDNLKKLMKETETYADALNKKVNRLRVDKQKLESDSVYKEQNEELKKLRRELSIMNDKIGSMEKELSRAKHIIDQQNSKIRGLEFEKSAMHEKFKLELDKASRAMRQEVERMREVMKQQYEEMRNLREQNVGISSDVRDIKDLLLKGTVVQPEIREKEYLDVNHLKTPRALPKSPNFGTRVPLTSRLEQPKLRQSTVRASVPQTTQLRPRTPSGGLPPLSKDEVHSLAPWLPNSRQANAFTRNAKGKRKWNNVPLLGFTSTKQNLCSTVEKMSQNVHLLRFYWCFEGQPSSSDLYYR